MCPLHDRRDCCGRKAVVKVKERKEYKRVPDVQRIEDSRWPDGFREECSDRELGRRKDQLIRQETRDKGFVECWLCHEPIEDYREIRLEHKCPKKMNGSDRNDSWANLALAHDRCNEAKGSKRIVDRGGNPLEVA